MDGKSVERAVAKSRGLLRNVAEPYRSLVFPVVFAQILSGNLQTTEASPKPIQRFPRTADKKPTRSSTLRKLIAEGWFKSERSLDEIRKELRNRGLPTKTTTLPSLVLPLVLKGKLKRKVGGKGKKEFYVYFA